MGGDGVVGGGGEATYLELVHTLDSCLMLVSVPSCLLLSLTQPALQLSQSLLPL